MRLRLLLSFVLIVLVSILSMVVVVRLSAEREVRAFMVRGGMRGLEDLVASLEEYYRLHGTWWGAESLLRTGGHGGGMGPGGGQGMGAGMMSQRLRLSDAQGKVIIDTLNFQAVGFLDPAELEQSISLQVDGRTVGYLYPEGGVAFGPGDQSMLLTRLNRAALVSASLAGGLAFFLALLLSYRLLRPITTLTTAAGELAAGDLSRRVPVQGQDELATLGKAFNHMAASLQQAEESRRAMTADIAHELRTPLSVERAHLEALQDGIYPLTPENLGPILEQNGLLTRLVEDLRTLALADAGQLPMQRVPTDLPALLGRVVSRFEPQAITREIALELSPGPDARVPFPRLALDPARIEQLLGNLLANALRHTPVGGKIRLDISSSPAAVQVTVRDTGPGIPEDALPHIFERFYRADRARSRAEGGSGLGLAIARQIAQAHGGSLTAANHPQGGAIFTLSLPNLDCSEGP